MFTGIIGTDKCVKDVNERSFFMRIKPVSLIVILFASITGPFGQISVLAATRPNVVLIMCDDMGYEGVSVYGSSTYDTPNLDGLAKSGLYFKHAYSTPICTPSRVQIMTGKYNFRNYVKFGLLDASQKTFANYLQEVGYETAICGKWQLGGDSSTVRKFGFSTHCLWHLDGRDSRYWNPRISRDGELLENLDKSFGPDVMTDFACDFIQQDRDNPFLLYFPMSLPHWPFVPTPDSDQGGSRDRSGKYDGRAGGEEYFPDMVNYLDKLTGRIVRALETSKQLENTLIIFTCDNGCAINITSEMKGRKIKGGKASLPDNGTHVAMIAHWPEGIPEKRNGSFNRQHAYLPDFMATCIDLSGAAYPKNLPSLAGNSLVRTLRNPKKATHTEPIFWEHEGNAAMRNGNLKLVREYEKPWELYDLAHDRTELLNLAESESNLLNDMVNQWEEWARPTGVAFPKRFNMYQFLREKKNQR